MIPAIAAASGGRISRYLRCAGRLLHFLDSGTRGAGQRTVVLWHGVFGTCEDHRLFAHRLATLGYRVICPDAPLCGLSDWAADPAREASLGFYAEAATDLLRQLGIRRTSWIGTSKGGALGIMLAGAAPTGLSIDHLVLNDVGPGLPERFRAGLARMLAEPPVFDDFGGFLTHVRCFLEKGGLAQPEAGWERIARAWMRRTDDGRFTLHHDPALAAQFEHSAEDFDLWARFDRIRAPTLLLRGQNSIVPPDEAAAMAARGPQACVVDRPGGHISLLEDPAEQQLILDFIGPAQEAGNDNAAEEFP